MYRYVFVLGISVFFYSAAANSACLCPKFDPAKARIAFLGSVDAVVDKEASISRQEALGKNAKGTSEITYTVIEKWKGVGEKSKKLTFTLTKADPECGYGPSKLIDGGLGKEDAIFGVFADDKLINLCNSIIIEEQKLPGFKNPFKENGNGGNK